MSARSVHTKGKGVPATEHSLGVPLSATVVPETSLPLLLEERRPLTTKPGFWVMIAVGVVVLWFVGDFWMLTDSEVRTKLTSGTWCNRDSAIALGQRTTYRFTPEGTYSVDISAGEAGILFSGSGNWELESAAQGQGVFHSHPESIGRFTWHRAGFVSVGEEDSLQYLRLHRCETE